jgi:uncharacterized protein (DUF2062 family)/SAM-dependent methyltransferase
MRLARRLFTDLRLEGAGRTREAVAMGLGAFIGCSPFYGFHLLLVLVIGRLLGLNRLKMYVAANISNPLFAPFLILAEVQTGAWLRRAGLHELTLDYVRATDPWVFGADLLLGSLAVGLVVGGLIGIATFSAAGPAPVLPPHLARVFAAAADRYLEYSITAWEFGRGKLRRDPVYRAALSELAAAHDTIVDVGCGQGLMLATLIEARTQAHLPDWPDGAPAPAFARLVGIETRERVARLARRALGGHAEISHAAAPAALPASFDAALLFDVLHLMSAEAQQALVAALFDRLTPGGLLLVRDVDAAAGRGFRAVRIGNRLKAIAVGRWRQTFHFRSAAGWRQLFGDAGFRVEMRPMGEGTPFANVLFRLVKPGSAPLPPVADGHQQPDLS